MLFQYMRPSKSVIGSLWPRPFSGAASFIPSPDTARVLVNRMVRDAAKGGSIALADDGTWEVIDPATLPALFLSRRERVVPN